MYMNSYSTAPYTPSSPELAHCATWSILLVSHNASTQRGWGRRWCSKANSKLMILEWLECLCVREGCLYARYLHDGDAVARQHGASAQAHWPSSKPRHRAHLLLPEPGGIPQHKRHDPAIYGVGGLRSTRKRSHTQPPQKPHSLRASDEKNAVSQLQTRKAR